MKKLLSSLLMLSIATAGSIAASCRDSCDCAHTSKTYLSIRPQFQSVSPEYVAGFRHERMFAREDGKNGALQLVLFGGKTTNRDDLARYFMPFCKKEIVVDEQLGLDLTFKGDVKAQLFNIYTIDGNFRSRVLFRPEQSTIGLGFHYRQAFCVDEDRGRAYWASLSFPITHVRNDMGLCEIVESDGGGPNEAAAEVVVANMKEALDQPAYLFGKVSPCALKETSVAELEFKVGYAWLQFSPCHVEGYIGVIVPTGTRPDGKYLFEPIVGNGKHAGISFGSAYGMDLWCNEGDDRSLRMEWIAHSQYLFKREQTRSFDLVGKPWSRYMPVYANQDQAQAAADDVRDMITNITQGVNVFTQKVDVTPGFSHNSTASLVYTSCNFQGELGYNFYARRGECVELSCRWQEGPALVDAQGGGFTNPIRDITGNYFLEQAEIFGPGTVEQPDLPVPVNQYEASIITEDMLDLVSATAPCAISNTVYGAVTYNFDRCDYPLFVNAGASYEFAHNTNAMPSRWTVWGKFGMSF